MTPKDRQRLAGVHPLLVEKIEMLLGLMDQAGHPMRVAQGLRSTAQQQALYAQGRTVKGPVVTRADGIRAKSNHQAKADGYGHAVDLCFVGPEPFAESHPWALLGETAVSLGLAWGGHWTTFPDRPHVELRPTLATGLNA